MTENGLIEGLKNPSIKLRKSCRTITYTRVKNVQSVGMDIFVIEVAIRSQTTSI
jgi:hypothetical protein